MQNMYRNIAEQSTTTTDKWVLWEMYGF